LWCSNKFEKRYLIFGHDSNIDPPSPPNSHGILPMKYCKVHTKIKGQFFVLQVHHLVALIANLFNSCLEPQLDFLSKSKFKLSILILAINYVLTLQINISSTQTTTFENVNPLWCIKFGNSFSNEPNIIWFGQGLPFQPCPQKIRLLASAKSQSENVIYKYWECFFFDSQASSPSFQWISLFSSVLGFHLTYFIVFALTFVASLKLKFKQWHTQFNHIRVLSNS